jgi:AP-4 complex subunit mu-1|mmetsp:Transcript_14990/g.46541  ORF Transcript_14990/g.46541 Transcript_14990/m.46541 type:complete len:448 (+) Transcript_14990:205-1548(+)
MLSKFFVLSPRGDAIISKDYRGDSPRGEVDFFFRRVKFWSAGPNRAQGKAPPVFRINDVTYVWVERNGLMFACNTQFNASPSTIIELLQRVVKVVKDYCGVLSEEAIRKNFILIYELLDELIDFGYPQDTSTESLKAFVYNEPVLVSAQKMRVPSLSTKTTPSSSVHKPISAGKTGSGAIGSVRSNRNEIFVDILERLTMLFSSSGVVINSTVDGCIQMKSYLSGNPELRLALNEDLVIGKGGPCGGVTLDDCNFHECVRLDDFETSRLLSFIPPEGEFVALNYRCTGDFRAPFHLLPQIEEITPFQLEISILVRAELPETNYGSNFIMTVPCPRNTAGTSSPSSNSAAVTHSVDYDSQSRKLIFSVKKFQGGAEHRFRAKITLSSLCTAQTLKEVGPISLTFEIPMYNVTNLQVKYLRIAEHSKFYNPYRWVRYITRSSSYVCRCG